MYSVCIPNSKITPKQQNMDIPYMYEVCMYCIPIYNRTASSDEKRQPSAPWQNNGYHSGKITATGTYNYGKITAIPAAKLRLTLRQNRKGAACKNKCAPNYSCDWQLSDVHKIHKICNMET